MKTLTEYMNEMHQIDTRMAMGDSNSDEMMVLDEIKNLADKVATARHIHTRDALYLIKKVIDKIIR